MTNDQGMGDTELAALILSRLGGSTVDSLRAVLMDGLNDQPAPGEAVALNDDAALETIILNAFEGKK